MNNSIYNQLEIVADNKELRDLLKFSDSIDRLSIEYKLSDNIIEGNEFTIISIPFTSIIYEESVSKLAELTSTLKKCGLRVYKKEKIFSFITPSIIDNTFPFKVKPGEILITWRDLLSYTVLDYIYKDRGILYIKDDYDIISIKSFKTKMPVHYKGCTFYPIIELDQCDLNFNVDQNKQLLSDLFFNGVFFQNKEITDFILDNLSIKTYLLNHDLISK